jgi:hypothetical protein
MKKEALRPFDGALAMNQARVWWLFMPKRDRFTQSSFTRSLCSRKRSAAESGGTGTRLRNGCALWASVSMLRSHSSWPRWAINALLFDYRSDYRRNVEQGRLSKKGAIIDQSADPFRAKANVIGDGAGMCQRKIPQLGAPVQRRFAERIRMLARRDAPYQVFVVIAVRLDRRHAVPVEEFSRGRDVLQHKRDAGAGTIQSARGVGSNR